VGAMYDVICSWDNLRLAYRNAARGKRGRGAAARFEYRLADNLLQLQEELVYRRYRPGPYDSFYIHDPKHRLISAAPFRDRVVVSHNSPDPAGNAVRLCESPERRRRAGRPRRKREMARPFPGRACVRREPGAGRANIERVRLLGACPEPDRRSRREVES
jgi:hypothetical protein